jgi:hypothetical protein
MRPKHKHATTRAHPDLERQGIAINFSTHILEAFQRAQAAADRGELLEVSDDAENLI